MNEKITYNSNFSQQQSSFSEQQLRHCVYAFLLRRCLNLRNKTYFEIKNKWLIDDNDIFRLAIASVPTRVENLSACSYLAQYFNLVRVECFYFHRGCWRLDVDELHAASGIIMPVRDERMYITSLRVFRHVKDERPFILRLRKNNDSRNLRERSLAA